MPSPGNVLAFSVIVLAIAAAGAGMLVAGPYAHVTARRVAPLVSAWVMPVQAAPAQKPAASAPAGKKELAAVVSFIDQNCMACHNADDHIGNMDLEKYKDAGTIRGNGAEWAKILMMVGSEKMPPPESGATIEKADRDRFISAAKSVLGDALATRPASAPETAPTK